MNARWVFVVAALAVPLQASGQDRGAAPRTAKTAAPIDLTGYWVSVVTEDWRYRMVTPTKGDYQGVPMTAESKKVADAWSPEADQAAGEACKSYGAPAGLRAPGRIHVTWQDEQTLRVDLDAGTQTRLFRFDSAAPSNAARSWQGDSTARWETAGGRGGGPVTGNLKVTTTNLRAGYLRKNGVPYSENASVTEYFDLGSLPDGTPILIVTSVVEDARFLAQPFVVSTQFKKQADASGWDPTPCSATW